MSGKIKPSESSVGCIAGKQIESGAVRLTWLTKPKEEPQA